MSGIMNLSRRNFLKMGLLAGGGLLLGVSIPARAAQVGVASPSSETFVPNAFLRIGKDGRVIIIVNKSEMGQGVYTSLPMLVAEELEADWSKISVKAAPVDPAYNHALWGAIQGTGGSTSVRSEWERLSKAGAAARMMLVAAAADVWKVKPETCRAEKGFVIHGPTKRRLSYGQLAQRAGRMKVPEEISLKNREDSKIIGKPMKRLDTPEKIDGRAIFGLDVKIPGLLTAVVARPPVFGGKVRNVNTEKAKAVPGVKAVEVIDAGVAVAAEGFWAANLGRDALEISWDEGEGGRISTESLRKEYADLAKMPGAVARKEGSPQQALSEAARKITAEYEVPFLAHACMEPLNCVVDLRADGCEIWTGTQFQTVDRNSAAQIAGLRPEQVQIHTTFLGGGFGRRANPKSDFVAEAVQVAKAMKKPVKIIWTREDDLKGGYYRPMWYSRMTAGLDEQANLIAWHHTLVGQSILAGTAFAGMIKDGIDATSVEGANNLPYDIPNLLVDLHTPKVGVPVLWWRSVGHSHTAFVVESFLDEVAQAAGKDPYEFRRKLLAKHPRDLAVLETAAQKGGWGEPLAKGRARGIAVHESFGSFVAQVAEVSVDPKGKVRVHKVVCAIDCGRYVNPDTIKAQMESGIAFGLSAALYGEITLKDGRVEQSNFNDYPLLPMSEMPPVEVHIVPSKEKPGGVGEPGVPPIAPAVGNAIFALTGKRIRRLPISVEELKRT
jgi:isoquinoline 1-oxidoreductase beta subunit